MPRQKTGRPLGRPPRYQHEDERPVTVSLRIPPALATQMKRYASLHRQSVTELLLDGLKWRIGEGDPRGLGIDLPHKRGQSDNEYYGNAEIPTTVLEEIRTALARQAIQLEALTQTLGQHPLVSLPSVDYDNTATKPVGQQRTPKIKRKEYRDSSNTVLQKDGNTAASDTSAQQLYIPDKAALVARLHQMRASGLSYQQVADRLNTEGVPTLSGKGQWQKGTVAKLLAKYQAQPV